MATYLSKYVVFLEKKVTFAFIPKTPALVFCFRNSSPSWLDWDERQLILGFFQKREIPWEKVPFVPRPSLVPDPITAFGKRRQETKQTQLPITSPSERAKIKPKILLHDPAPYVSARDVTREKVFSAMLRPGAHMDTVLPKLHKLAEQPNLPYKQRIVSGSEFIY